MSSQRKQPGVLSDLEAEVHYGIIHDLFESRESRAALRAYQFGVGGPEVVRLLREPVRKYRSRVVRELEPPFRRPKLRRGNLVLGADGRGRDISIDPQMLTAGVLALGSTGSAKTTLVCWILSQLAGICKGIWASDMYKSDLRRMLPVLAQLGMKLIVLPARRGRWNPLQADGDIRIHEGWIGSLLTRTLGLPPRARHVLSKSIHTLYRDCGAYSGIPLRWPTLFDLFEHVKHDRSSPPVSREAILDRLGALLVSLGPAALAWRRAWSPKDLSKFAIVFEMRGVSESAKHLVLSSLLFSTLYERAERGVSNAKLDLVCVLEDAQQFLNSNSETSSGLSPIDELAGLIRGLGVGLIAACQSLSGLSPKLVANLSTKFMLRCGTHSDYHRLSQDMALSAEQLNYARLNLRPGLMVASCADTAWRHPFLVHTPNYRLTQSVSESKVETSLQLLAKLPTEFATEFEHWQPHESVTVSSKKQGHEPVDAFALRFLVVVVENPGLASTKYAGLAGMKTSKAISVRESLVLQGLVTEHRVSAGKTGRSSLILEATKKGKGVYGSWAAAQAKGAS